MNPTILGVIGPGLLNQVSTLGDWRPEFRVLSRAQGDSLVRRFLSLLYGGLGFRV